MSLQQQPPAWHLNHKKRVIPNHLEAKKKLSFQILSDGKKLTTTQKLVVDDGFNLLSFGQNKRGDKLTMFDDLRFDETINDTVEEVTFGDDQPPLRLIHDLTEEVLVSKPRQKVDSLLSKDPKQFPLVFSSKSPTTAHHEEPQTSSQQELAVIVFGYLDARAPQVIRYFRECGPILEKFDLGSPMTLLTAVKHTKKMVPIFSGPSWVKITYELPELALDALLRNGTVFNGEFIGVMPYSKDAVEKMERRQLSADEDVGKLDSQLLDGKPHDDRATQMAPPLLVLKMEIKDGLKLFVKADATPNTKTSAGQTKMGWVENATKKLFGFYEL